MLGKTGQLACELQRRPWPAEWVVEFVPRGEIDLAEPDHAADEVAERTPDIVINAAAYTAVDKAESEPELATRVNALGPAAVAVVCHRLEIPFVTLSTDYVFDGSKQGPYTEEDAVCPGGAYGRSKAEGERLIRAVHDNHLILRTSWVFSCYGSNFVRTMLRLGGERSVLSVVADQRGRPTAASDLASAVIGASNAIVGDLSLAGTYHVANAEPTTWYGFASAIFEGAKVRGARTPELLKPIRTAEYPTAARRPANSELDTRRFEATFGITLGGWRAPLADVLDELLSPAEFR